MKSTAARGRASSNKASYGGAGLWAEGGGGVKQGGERRAVPGEASSRTGVEVRRTGQEEEEEGCWDATSADKEEDRLVLE